jgi:hypothetical protein
MKRGVNPQKEKKIYFFKLYKRNEIIWFSLANEIAEARDLFSTHTQSVEVQQVKLTNHEWKFKDRISIEIHELNTQCFTQQRKSIKIIE